jgi:hypothetical protein
MLCAGSLLRRIMDRLRMRSEKKDQAPLQKCNEAFQKTENRTLEKTSNDHDRDRVPRRKNP